MEQTAQQERRIHVIPATKQAAVPGRASGRRQRVAAYCRVSTDSEEQLTSYTAQPLSPSGEPPPEPSKRGT